MAEAKMTATRESKKIVVETAGSSETALNSVTVFNIESDEIRTHYWPRGREYKGPGTPQPDGNIQ